MATFLAVFAFMLIIVAGMAVGVMFGRKPLKGSCGGMAALGMETECDVCGGDQTRCEKENQTPTESARGNKSANLAVDATNKSGRR